MTTHRSVSVGTTTEIGGDGGWGTKDMDRISVEKCVYGAAVEKNEKGGGKQENTTQPHSHLRRTKTPKTIKHRGGGTGAVDGAPPPQIK